jgi:hypothetical protein
MPKTAYNREMHGLMKHGRRCMLFCWKRAKEFTKLYVDGTAEYIILGRHERLHCGEKMTLGA